MFVEVDVGFVEDAVSSRWKIQIQRTVFLMAFVFVAACNSESTEGIPTPVPPTDGGDTGLPTTGPGMDTRLPPLLIANAGKEVEITLKDTTNFIGLNDIATPNIVVPPIVDTVFLMEILGGRSSTPTGTMVLGFEDSRGFLAAQMSSYPKYSRQTSSELEMIFTDEVFSVKVVGNIVNDTLSGKIHYRVRTKNSAGELLEKQCLPKVCKGTQTSYTWVWDNYPYTGHYTETVTEVACPSDVQAQKELEWLNECKSYMNLGNLKELGSFTTPYSSWVK